MRLITRLLVLCMSFAVAACADAPDPQAFDAGVRAYDAGHYHVAFNIFREMAPIDMAAARNVALMLRKGEGVKKDPEEARLWMTEAAKGGSATAAADLGEMLLNGEGGPSDPEAALPWLTAAASAGHPIAEFELGEMYEAGQVVPKDIARAKLLYGEAATRGVTAARDRLAELNGMSGPAEPGLPSAH